ncbi:MAG: transglutaminase TgpA family protein [Brevefilum fermentans]|jgi:transglutaminase-like putative cysteine protease|nr:transglutaminaseTgpA domain-containing protein [Brevefilum fermentans]
MIKTRNTLSERWWDMWVAIFAMGVVLIVSWRLWVTEWTGDLYILVFLTFFAGLTGLALGYSKFSPLVAALFSAVYGTFCMGWLFGTTVDLDITWRERIVNHLSWRLQLSIEQFNANQAVTDPILFLVIMAVLLWIMASIATFIIVRQGSVWPVLIPLGISMLVVSHYDQDLARNTRFLMTFMFFTLILVGRINFLTRQKQWNQEGISTTHETHTVLTRAMIILALILVILAWLIPITPQQRTRYAELWLSLIETWEEFRGRFGDILVLETTTDTKTITFFDETMALGSGTPVSEAVVFTVEVTQPPPAAYRNYWYARSYDYYEDGKWTSSPGVVNTMRYPDDFQILFPDWVGGVPAAYSVTSQVGQVNNLYVTGLPTRVDRPVEALTRWISPTEEDLIALLASPELYLGETYQVESLVRVPTASQLRHSETEYPDWLARYTQLPADFSPRIASLAEDIVNMDDHPYDMAVAITRYLRINIEYARTIPPVPAGADPMEWFLFDHQAGFCNYYAAAQVLMLRSLGIPARFTVGYAPGEYDLLTQTYTVRELDSHAWPEVYFVDFGWVPFEPTVSQPALVLPRGSDPGSSDFIPPERGETPLIDDAIDEPIAEMDESPPTDLEEYEVLPPPVEGSTVAWILLIVFLLVMVLAVLILQRPDLFKITIDPLPVLLERLLLKCGKTVPDWLRRWSDLARMSPAQKAYRRLCRSLKILGLPSDPSLTPAERAQMLTRRIPQAYQPALEIVEQYHLDQFSDHLMIQGQSTAAGWQVLRMALKTRLRNIFTKQSIQ